MKWFNNPKTFEGLKRQYKALALKHHPDRVGGNVEVMKAINNEYDELFKRLKTIHETVDGNTYTARNTSGETPDDFKKVISSLITLDGIQIEICGSWIWLTGNTYSYRDKLKNLNFRFSRSKKAWYYHNDGYRKTSHKSFTLEQIRSLYGSEIVNSKPNLKLAIV